MDDDTWIVLHRLTQVASPPADEAAIAGETEQHDFKSRPSRLRIGGLKGGFAGLIRGWMRCQVRPAVGVSSSLRAVACLITSRSLYPFRPSGPRVVCTWGFHRVSDCIHAAWFISGHDLHESNLPKVRSSRDDERASEGSPTRK
jgi:hypothetical protein